MDASQKSSQTGQSAAELLAALRSLRRAVTEQADRMFRQWEDRIVRPGFRESALNLAEYVVLRRSDLRHLQDGLAALGLSSLGRLEGRVLANLDAVIAALSAITGGTGEARFPSHAQMFHGQELLKANADRLFGARTGPRQVRLMVTLPSEAAEEPALIETLVSLGMDVVRINCAHDDAAAWGAMTRFARDAAAAAGRDVKILMDLAGPKCRTSEVHCDEKHKRLRRDDRLFLARRAFLPLARHPAQAICSIGSVHDHLVAGAPVWFDDGHAGGIVERLDEEGAVVLITHAPPKGVKLRADKGLNFPETDLGVGALTEKDLTDLDFVVRHADMVGYSFVQSAEDVARLQTELAARCDAGAEPIGIVAKIETPRAVRNLPGIIVQAAGRQPFAVMIARGDLGVEIGFARLAEIQEEMLWLCEAAHVPVIWATEVLDNLIKEGMPTRGEMTDAAMAARAECVMLNKGPYIADALKILDALFVRMAEHQSKKTPRLRALQSW